MTTAAAPAKRKKVDRSRQKSKRPLVVGRLGTARIYCAAGSPRPGRFCILDEKMRQPLSPDILAIQTLDTPVIHSCTCKRRRCAACAGTDCKRVGP